MRIQNCHNKLIITMYKAYQTKPYKNLIYKNLKP